MDLEKNELEQFQTYLKKKGAAENTIIAYQTAVRQFYRPPDFPRRIFRPTSSISSAPTAPAR